MVFHWMIFFSTEICKTTENYTFDHHTLEEKRHGFSVINHDIADKVNLTSFTTDQITVLYMETCFFNNIGWPSTIVFGLEEVIELLIWSQKAFLPGTTCLTKLILKNMTFAKFVSYTIFTKLARVWLK